MLLRVGGHLTVHDIDPGASGHEPVLGADDRNHNVAAKSEAEVVDDAVGAITTLRARVFGGPAHDASYTGWVAPSPGIPLRG